MGTFEKFGLFNSQTWIFIGPYGDSFPIAVGGARSSTRAEQVRSSRFWRGRYRIVNPSSNVMFDDQLNKGQLSWRPQIPRPPYLCWPLLQTLRLTSCFELVVDPVYHGDSILGRLLFDFTYVIPAGCFQAFRWLFIFSIRRQGRLCLGMFNLVYPWNVQFADLLVAEKWGEGMRDCVLSCSFPCGVAVLCWVELTVKITRVTILDRTTFPADECRDGLCFLPFWIAQRFQQMNVEMDSAFSWSISSWKKQSKGESWLPNTKNRLMSFVFLDLFRERYSIDSQILSFLWFLKHGANDEV